MGCFLACFCSPKNKDRKRRHRHKVLPRDQRHGSYEPLKPPPSLNQQSKETPIIISKETPIISEQRVKPEEQQLGSSTRKKVTFDLNVKTYENVSEPEPTNYSWENDEDKERGKEEEKREISSQSLSASEDDSVTSSLGSYPPNHRYQNCRDSDDDDDEDDRIDSGESDLDYDDDDDDDDDDADDDDADDEDEGDYADEDDEIREEYEEEVICGSPEGELKPLPLNQNARDRSKYVHSVLNPVENLSQWKAVKAKPRAAATPLKNQKENANFEQETQIPFSTEPTFKPSPLKSNQSFFSHSRLTKQEITVDASLSNWLVSAETTPNTQTSSVTFATESAERSRSQRPNSSRSPEDRPILGALTVEELKQLSTSSLPRRSPSRISPDEMPIIGSVGSYWSSTGQAMDSKSGSSCKGIPNITSKYREDERVHWHSTPFETRLEKALDRGSSAEAYSSKC